MEAAGMGAGASPGTDVFAPKATLGTRGRLPRVSEDKLPLPREIKATPLPPLL